VISLFGNRTRKIGSQLRVVWLRTETVV